MTEDADYRRDLLDRIGGRRASIEEYLRTARPRGTRLVNISIVSSAVAAALTAGPALGGETFSTSVADGLSLSSDSTVWRTLCFLALGVSVVAAISTNLAKSHDTAQRITAAEATNAELEGLRTLLEFGQISVGDAAKLYQQYLTKVPWIEGHPGPPPAGPNRPPPQYGPPSGPYRGPQPYAGPDTYGNPPPGGRPGPSAPDRWRDNQS